MPAIKDRKGEGLIQHYGSVRLRVTGSASLKLRLISDDAIRENVLVPITLATATNIEPTRLSNFTQQSAQLEIETDAINEYFLISKIVIFTKPTATSYPGS